MGWREDSTSLAPPLPLLLLMGPSHLFPPLGLLLTGALPVYSCSKSGEDLFPSQEPIYSAFSFSNPVTLQLLFVWLHLPNKRNYSLSLSTPGWGRTGGPALAGRPGGPTLHSGALKAGPLTLSLPCSPRAMEKKWGLDEMARRPEAERSREPGKGGGSPSLAMDGGLVAPFSLLLSSIFPHF